jgi:hypothetical protein
LFGENWEMKGSLDPVIGQVEVEGNDENDVPINMIK